jgi:hypothetical protein
VPVFPAGNGPHHGWVSLTDCGKQNVSAELQCFWREFGATTSAEIVTEIPATKTALNFEKVENRFHGQILGQN